MMIAALAVTACSPPLPTATPVPTPDPTQTPPPATAVDEFMAELFWLSVDWVGRTSGDPGINRTLDFEDAKTSAREFLWFLLGLNVEALAEVGVAPSRTFPANPVAGQGL